MTYKEYVNRTVEQIVAEEVQRQLQLEAAKQAQLNCLQRNEYMSETTFLIHCKICGKLLKREGYMVYEHPNYCNDCWEKAEAQSIYGGEINANIYRLGSRKSPKRI